MSLHACRVWLVASIIVYTTAAPAQEGHPAPAEAAPPAVEPPAESPATAEPVHEGGEITVVGSHIKRTAFSQLSPVLVLDRTQLEASGAVTIADVSRFLSVSGGSEFNADVFTQLATPGTAQFNLRGLGLNSTLVLLNGRRVVSSGATSDDGSNFVDINSLPLSLVERIEILRDGASALYGSDAVAGVVNIVTRTNYDLTRFEGSWQTTTVGRVQHDGQLSMMAGGINETSRAMAAISFFDRSGLLFGDRGWVRSDTMTSAVGRPGTFVLLDPNTGAPIPGGSKADPDCPQAAGSFVDANGFCAMGFKNTMALVNPERRVNVFATAERRMSDNVSAFTEVGFARNNGTRETPPAQAMLKTIVVPANHPDNVFGVPAVWNGRVLDVATATPQQHPFESDTWRAVAGLQGSLKGVAGDSLLADWSWKLDTTWSASRYSIKFRDSLAPALQAAINSCTGADKSGCFNPFYSAERGTGTPNSPAVIEKIMGDVIIDTHTNLFTVDGVANGSVVKLPAGNLQVAVGSQYRLEQQTVTYNHEYTQRQFGFFSGADSTKGSRHINAVFGELVAPIVEGSEAQAAIRWEQYSDLGGTVNPKLALGVRPFAPAGEAVPPVLGGLLLRGSYGTAFHAPSLFQLTGSQSTMVQFRDPGPVFRPVFANGQPNLKPERASTWTVGIDWTLGRRLNLSADWWHYDYSDLIVKENAVAIFNADPNDPRVNRDPITGLMTGMSVDFINAAHVKTDGIDLGGTWRIRTQDWLGSNAGQLAINLTGTYIRHYLLQLSAASKEEEGAGNRNFLSYGRSLPRWRWNFGLGWTHGGHSAQATVHYIGSYANDADKNAKINPQATLDLQYGYGLGEVLGRLTHLRVGVINAFNANPPFARGSASYDTKVHDPRGRLAYVSLAQEF
ncbi:MAG TPA: TonB-dependent receptor [Myxococcota bacterium]|nr:TonB-dependent receptor [Myxococcota bacterium]